MRIAIAIVVVIAFAPGATPDVEADQVEIEITNLQASRLLIKAGRLQDAHVFLEKTRPKNEKEWTERLFLLGRIEMRLGMPRRAVKRFEAILERRPKLTRVRLELAAAYYAAGLDDKAKLHFKWSLEQNLPNSVEAVVEKFLRQIDVRKPWSAFFSASLLPESKPSRTTEQEEVLVGGIPFQLDEDTRPSSGVGVLLSAGASISNAISDDLRSLLAISGGAKVYERSEWNDITISADLGVTQLYDQGSISEGLRLGWQWHGNERFRRSLGVWVRTRWQLSNSVRFDLPINVEYRKYDTQQYRDGSQIGVNPNFTFFIGERSLIGVEPRLELVGAEKPHHRHSVVGLSLRFKRVFRDGFSVSVNPYYHKKRYSATDPLIGITRIEEQLILSVSLSHRSLQYKGFIPSMAYVHERNRSNIPVRREYRNHGVNIGVSRAF